MDLSYMTFIIIEVDGFLTQCGFVVVVIYFFSVMKGCCILSNFFLHLLDYLGIFIFHLIVMHYIH